MSDTRFAMRLALIALIIGTMFGALGAVLIAPEDQRTFHVVLGDEIHLGLSSNLWEIKSSNEYIAPVTKDGVVTIQGVGTAQITAERPNLKRVYQFFISAGTPLPMLTYEEVLARTRKAIENLEPSFTYTMYINPMPRGAAWKKVLYSLSYKQLTGVDKAYLIGSSISSAKPDLGSATVDMTQRFLYRTGAGVARSYRDKTNGSELTPAEQALKAKTDEIIRTLNLRAKNLSITQKATRLHDYLVANHEYDLAAQKKKKQSHPSYDAYGLLVLGKGTCQAYAESYKLILNAVGIQCDYVTGVAPSNAAHGWNRVILEDGKGYYVDCTADDPVPDVKGRVKQNYLLVTESFLREKGYKFEKNN